MKLYEQTSKRTLFTRAAGLALLLTSAPVSAAEPKADCVFDSYAPSAVAPVIHDEYTSYWTMSWTRGVQLFVPAREGLTKEWLTTRVRTALTSAPQTCSGGPLPQVAQLEVYVASAETGFWIQLLARNERDTSALQSWARGLVDSH